MAETAVKCKCKMVMKNGRQIAQPKPRRNRSILWFENSLQGALHFFVGFVHRAVDFFRRFFDLLRRFQKAV